MTAFSVDRNGGSVNGQKWCHQAFRCPVLGQDIPAGAGLSGPESGGQATGIMICEMTLTQAYDEILDFHAAGTTAESIANFRPSEEAQTRVRELIARRSDATIAPAEEEELEEYLRLEHLMIMAKARAQVRLRS